MIRAQAGFVEWWRSARRALVGGLLLVAAALPQAARAGEVPTGVWSHAYAMYGEAKYPAGFGHYDYVNPDAPKGGTLNLGNPDRRASFTRLNPYLLKGSGAFGTYFFSFESLCDASQDEGGVMYGLLAEAIKVAPDLDSVSFRINPRARFNNGDPVTAADVKYSFDTMVSDKTSPAYSALFTGVKAAVVIDARTVRFDLAVRSRDTVYNLGVNLPIFSPKWGVGSDGKAKPFDQVINDLPITTGPYVVEASHDGRRLDMARDPNYWARDEGVRRGMFNFDRVIYRYYADNTVQFEAFKAHEIELLWETNLRRWGRQFTGSKFGPGKIIKKALPSGQGTYPRMLTLNLRRPLFQDIRVREALLLSLDFEWMNAQNFSLFARVDSAFSNSEYAASGLPSPGERAILEPFRGQLPPAVFGPPFENPRTDTSPTAFRDNLKRARDLLAQAGWKLGRDNVLHHADGRIFEFELLNNDADIAALLEPWQTHLGKLGIQMSFRQVDFALFAKRLEAFDYDVTQLNLGEFLLPSATLLKTMFASDQAKVEGSENYGGVEDAALDAAMLAMDRATTKAELIAATRAFDRVMMHSHFFIPWLRRPAFNAAWWDRFGMPSHTPRFFTLTNDTNNANPWPLMTWWDSPAAATAGAAKP